MKTNLKDPRILAGMLTVLFFMSAIGFMVQYQANGELTSSLNQEKLKAENLLSEKLSLEKDIMKVKNQVTMLQGSNQQLDKELDGFKKSLATKEAEYKKLKSENASLKDIKKQHAEVLALQKELDAMVKALNGKIAQLQKENGDLNRTVASLEERNKILAEDLSKAQIAFLDYSKIEATKKNEKLTANARKTKNLKVNFDTPSSLKDISFRIIDPKGNILTTTDGVISSRVIPSDNTLVASSKETYAGSANTKKIEMTYHPKKKLQPGVYKVEILSENLYISSLQVRLK